MDEEEGTQELRDRFIAAAENALDGYELEDYERVSEAIREQRTTLNELLDRQGRRRTQTERR